MPPIYSGSAEEWCYFSTDTTGSAKSVEIIIDNFESQMKKVSPLKSHQFEVKDTLWHIKVYPDSNFEEDKGNLGVFIYNDNKEDLTVKIMIEIGDEVGDRESEYVNLESKVGWGCQLAHQECKDLLIDGKLIIKVEVKVLNEEVTLIHGKGKFSNPVSDTKIVNLKIFEDKYCSDFCVICNGKSFPCHKVFLMARSPVFKTMIEGNMKEAKEGSVEFNNCTETVVESFVKFFYTGNVDEEILKENAVSFLDLGEQYDIAKLKAITEQAMIANLDKENMLSFFQAGELYKGKKIKAAAKIFLRQNRRSLVDQKDWKNARKDGHLVLELLEFFSMD